jgi:hypothetical protein
MAEEPPDTGEPDIEDSETLGGTLGRTLGSAVVIFALLAVIAVAAWFILR